MEQRNRLPGGDEGLLQVVADAVRHASAKSRRALWANVVTMAVALGLAVVDLVTGAGGLEPYRLSGLVAGIAGLSLLGVVYVLHHASQASSATCAEMTFFTLRTEVMHRIFLALPTMALLSAVFLAGAIGLFIPSAVARPFFAVAIVLFAGYLVLSIRAVVHTSRFLYSYAQQQAAAAAKAEAEATRAQLTALQAQLNPHFLFNTLNTVASLIRTNGSAAERTVENLSDVLRRTLDRSRSTLSTVRDEIDYLKAYLAIEQERWGSRLVVEWTVDAAALSLAVPPMTLQPLVENALKHGIGHRLDGGRVRIGVSRGNGRLRLSVADDGVGFAPRIVERTGLGNLRSRLATLYGDRSTVQIERNGRGATVVVELPAAQRET